MPKDTKIKQVQAKKPTPNTKSTPQMRQKQMPFELLMEQAALNPTTLAPADASRLQRIIGNRAVGGMMSGHTQNGTTTDPLTISLQRMLVNRSIQAKLAVSAPNDPYEQEADAVAKQVVSPIKPSTQIAQRQEGEDEIHKNPFIKAFERPVTGEPIQRSINPKIRRYVDTNQKVRHRKYGVGAIIAMKGKDYTVAFEKPWGEKKVSAKDLDLVEEDEKGKEEEEDIEVKEETISELMPELTHLEITKSSSKKYKMILKSEESTIVKVKNVGESEVKNYVSGKSLILKEKLSKVSEGSHLLDPEAKLVGQLRNKLDAYLILKKRKEEAEMRRTERLRSGEEGGELTYDIDQNTFYKRLDALGKGERIGTKKGNTHVQMLKIRLDRSIQLSVGGEEREITHLYTQKGSPTEIRCYLGTSEGVYQRVHTSLTYNNEEEKAPTKAHTMVQTGENVVVPGDDDVGTRVGFDTEEEKGKYGFGRRLLVHRTSSVSVGDWLKADDWDSFTPEQQAACELLAARFNEALDKVCASLVGDDEPREVDLLPVKYTRLDDIWLFGGARAATPEAEYEAVGKEQGGKKSQAIGKGTYKEYTAQILEDGQYDTKDIPEDEVIIGMVEQALMRGRKWAVQLAQQHNYDGYKIVKTAREFDMRFRIVNGEVFIRLRGG